MGPPRCSGGGGIKSEEAERLKTFEDEYRRLLALRGLGCFK